MDRNYKERPGQKARPKSLSARRAWIEISLTSLADVELTSLSARRAWIEIQSFTVFLSTPIVALRKESVDRNNWHLAIKHLAR